MAGVVFGWTPGAFWDATPAELAALVSALTGDEVAAADRGTLMRLMEAFPDG
ncbi:phage tail assembly chaperone [Sphingomonas qomolangmaensis]|uniref:Phage tail assembly chaperone n=1 Tax=Sphingomonas qomolangmaensis TaxID=2918765 RepID=A0ABY5L583_9SPHN|nr:phage tail assembly chaperone [Sphingomonas qomolangmaensis]UUL82115.1 phage tail assembly chaperone [Sphingomonas qomolangmaensis]